MEKVATEPSNLIKEISRKFYSFFGIVDHKDEPQRLVLLHM